MSMTNRKTARFILNESGSSFLGYGLLNAAIAAATFWLAGAGFGGDCYLLSVINKKSR